MIDKYKVLNFAQKMAANVWYTSDELVTTWGVSKEEKSGLVPHLKKRNMLQTKGHTSQIQYRLRHESHWTPEMVEITPIEPTGNGVIDTKLRKEAGLPEKQTSLDNLVAAATVLGTENGVMRNKLDRIRAILEEV